MKTFTLKILHKLATVVAALLLYGVIVVLQMPKHPQTTAAVEPASTHAPAAAAQRTLHTASARR